ncbi:MAG: ABC transporter ATP-binding protein, partial [Acidimicrobiales bacterium]
MISMAGVDGDDRLNRREAGQVMRRAARFLRPYRREVRGAVVLVIVSTAAVLAGPFLLKLGIDRGIEPKHPRTLDLAVIAYVVVAVIAYAASRFQILLISRAGEGFLRDMRTRVFDHLLRLSMPFYDREKAGVVISRMTSDVDSLQELVQQGLLQLAQSVLLIIGSVIVLTVVSPVLLAICLIPVPFVVLASIKFQRDSNAAYLTVRDRIGLTLSSLQEGISGVRVIQAYGREGIETERFAGRNHQLYRAHMRSVWVQAWYLPVIEGSALACTALVVGLGGKMVADGALLIGTVVFFVLTLSNLFEPVQQLSQLFNTVQASGAALNKLFDLLDTRVDLTERTDAVDLPTHGELRVEGVTFGYAGGEPVLRDVDLVLPLGEKLALVGPTGAGKSTLAKLMARLYDPTAGRVTFGGIDLRDARLPSLRTRITVVPQEGYLFAGTIRDNVRIGRSDATDAEVEQALASLGLLDRFRRQPQGLDTEVHERGSSLSAGERQLVSLARAALADPAVLVLDEATSSLDPGTEVLVEEALERLVAGRTVIVIAHRLSTAERADRVGVVADGRLEELGT